MKGGQSTGVSMNQGSYESRKVLHAYFKIINKCLLAEETHLKGKEILRTRGRKTVC